MKFQDRSSISVLRKKTTLYEKKKGSKPVSFQKFTNFQKAAARP
jgi:hypothetical protein